MGRLAQSLFRVSLPVVSDNENNPTPNVHFRNGAVARDCRQIERHLT